MLPRLRANSSRINVVQTLFEWIPLLIRKFFPNNMYNTQPGIDIWNELAADESSCVMSICTILYWYLLLASVWMWFHDNSWQFMTMSWQFMTMSWHFMTMSWHFHDIFMWFLINVRSLSDLSLDFGLSAGPSEQDDARPEIVGTPAPRRSWLSRERERDQSAMDW